MGFSRLLSSEGWGRNLTSSNKPMLYTASMSRRACRMLYTCRQVTTLPSVSAGRLRVCKHVVHVHAVCLSHRFALSVSPESGRLGICMTWSLHAVSLPAMLFTLSEPPKPTENEHNNCCFRISCWVPAGCSALSCCCLVALCYCEHYTGTQCAIMPCICALLLQMASRP